MSGVIVASTFTPDITPLTLAAHMNNYEILKILLDRGATLPMPHDVRFVLYNAFEIYVYINILNIVLKQILLVLVSANSLIYYFIKVFLS